MTLANGQEDSCCHSLFTPDQSQSTAVLIQYMILTAAFRRWLLMFSTSLPNHYQFGLCLSLKAPPMLSRSARIWKYPSIQDLDWRGPEIKMCRGQTHLRLLSLFTHDCCLLSPPGWTGFLAPVNIWTTQSISLLFNMWKRFSSLPFLAFPMWSLTF